MPIPQPVSRAPRTIPIAAPLAAALVMILVPAGCGYRMESPRLPNNRHSIGVEPIRNQTYEAELDIRLQEELRRLLYRESAVRVVEPERSELVLTVALSSLSLSRSRSLDSTTIAQIGVSLSGTITLRDAGTGQIIINSESVSASTSYDLPESALETPAVRDDAINTVLAGFASAVMQRLLLTF